jgi:ferric enterobactin receptor
MIILFPFRKAAFRQNLLLLLFLYVGLSFDSQAQKSLNNAKTYFVTGKVTKKNTAEPIAGVSVVVEALKRGTTTSALGYFLLKLPAGKHTLRVSSTGFISQTTPFEITDKGLDLSLTLEEKVTELEEVSVNSQTPQQQLKTLTMGVTQLSMKTLKKLPAFLGETDIIRNVLMLPGISTVGEGATGFNVRGGNIDQNLVLMDDAPVFNTSHFFGLFSVFNPDVVKDFSLYRGGVPAQFGGRASSVLDIRLKEPFKDRFYVQGGVGPVASRLAIDGPIIKDKLGIYVAGRASYAGYLLDISPNPSVQSTEAGFYDLTAKLQYQSGLKDRVSLTFYRGFDLFKLPSDSLSRVEINAGSSRFEWITQNLSARWNHNFSEKLFLNIVGVHSTYESNMIGTNPSNEFDLLQKLTYQQLRADLGFYTEKHKFDAGLSAVRYQIRPGDFVPNNEQSNVNTRLLPEERSLELAAYLTDEWTLTPKLALQVGLRFTHFINQGPGTVYTYRSGVARDSTTITGQRNVGSGEAIQTYNALEPRLALRWAINNEQSVKVSYNRMVQFLQQIANTTAALPTARWKLADTYLQPTVADQWSLGYFHNFGNFETSIEGYYKRLDQVPDFRDGANLLLERYPEAYVLQGVGRSYGVELQVKKNIGKLTGWLAYTFSRSEQQINGAFPEDRINQGKFYPTNFDKPHQINLVGVYQLNKRVSFSANFTYSTGRPFTFPDDKFYVGRTFIGYFSGRNQARIPDYHRLDISVTIDPDYDKKKRLRGSWIFAFYNVYARRNAYSVFFRSNNPSIVQFYNTVGVYRLSVLGTIFPSITYNFKF